MTIEIGKPAPEFSLFNSEKQDISLSSLRGKNVVILFVPHAFTSVCTAELCEIRDHLHEYTALNAEVIGISVDTIHTLAKWKQEQQYTFHLLSDFNKEVSTAYGSIYDTFGYRMKGVSKRSAFVVDKEGIVRYAEILDDAGKVPNLTAIKDLLASLN